MASILFLDTGSHVEFLDAVAARLETRGHHAWIAAIQPREHQLFERFAGKRIVPASLGEIDAMPSSQPLPFLSLAREEAALARLLPRGLADRDAERERTLYRARFRRLVGWFHQFMREHDVKLLVCWNGLRMRGLAATEAARSAGARLLFAENGYFPKTIQLDPKGVNAGASIASLPGSFFDTVAWDPAAWEAVRAECAKPPRPERPLRDLGKVEPIPERWFRSLAEKIAERSPARRESVPETSPEPWLEGWRRRQGKDRWRKEPAFALDSLPSKYVLLPLQVRTDTQILDYSPLVHDMKTMVELIERAAKSIDPALGLVVKEHPKDAFAHPELEAAAKARGVLWARNADLRTLLERAAVVATVNSTVGVEAMIAGTPVLTLGEALFNKEGIVHHAATRDEIPVRLREALAAPRDAERVRRFLLWMSREWLVRAHPRFIDEESIENAARAIEERGLAEG